MTVLDTPEQINAFRLSVIRRAIQMYLKTGMQVNRMYTPQNMRHAVSEVTGCNYPRSRRGLMMAEQDLSNILDQYATKN